MSFMAKALGFFFRVQGLGFRGLSSGFRLRLRVWGFGVLLNGLWGSAVVLVSFCLGGLYQLIP